MAIREEYIIIGLSPIVCIILEIIILKICLRITKAEKRTDFKWIIISICMQIGMILFVLSPMILMGFSDAFNNSDGPPPEMFPMIFLAIIIDINLINVLYEIGIGKSIFVFLLFALPVTFLGFALGTTIPNII